MKKTQLKLWLRLSAYAVTGVAAALLSIHSHAADAKAPVATTAGSSPSAKFQNKISQSELLKGLREGGYVIYIRHTQTSKDYADQADPKLDLNDCKTQRSLNAKGINQAKNIGIAFKKANIPVGDVLASDYCRAWKAADLAFGRYQRTPELNFVKSEKYDDAQKLQMSNAVTPLLAALPKPGTNTVIVGHDDVFDAATGIYPEPQGMAYILKPDGKGKFEILANMKAEGWAKLAK
jgi:phosphohistidine phosphatase SixA